MLFYQTVDLGHCEQTVLNGPMSPAQVAETEQRPNVILFIRYSCSFFKDGGL